MGGGLNDAIGLSVREACLTGGIRTASKVSEALCSFALELLMTTLPEAGKISQRRRGLQRDSIVPR